MEKTGVTLSLITGGVTDPAPEGPTLETLVASYREMNLNDIQFAHIKRAVISIRKAAFEVRAAGVPDANFHMDEAVRMAELQLQAAEIARSGNLP
jgi:hypothetical protein